MPADDVVRRVVGFGAALRAAGVTVGPGRTSLAVAGLEQVEFSSMADLYWTLRQTLVTRRDDLLLFDALFTRWFPGSNKVVAGATRTDAVHGSDARTAEAGPSGESEGAPGWTRSESLRTKDFALVTAEELAELGSAIAQLGSLRPHRRSRRHEPRGAGRQLDLRRTLRSSTAAAGDPFARSFRQRANLPRRILLLCDISGSMAPYAKPLLLFGNGLLRSGRGVEVFSFGTRLTRLTAQLAGKDPGRGLTAATEKVVDWSGGTRIGASLKLFNDGWGKGAAARGAIVIIGSDGWERDDPKVVEHEMARLSRRAYVVIWSNPCKGDPEYQPLAGGMRAALPYIDSFVSGHNLSSLEELATLVAGVRGRHTASVPRLPSDQRLNGLSTIRTD